MKMKLQYGQKKNVNLRPQWKIEFGQCLLMFSFISNQLTIIKDSNYGKLVYTSL